MPYCPDDGSLRSSCSEKNRKSVWSCRFPKRKLLILIVAQTRVGLSDFALLSVELLPAYRKPLRFHSTYGSICARGIQLDLQKGQRENQVLQCENCCFTASHYSRSQTASFTAYWMSCTTWTMNRSWRTSWLLSNIHWSSDRWTSQAPKKKLNCKSRN